MNSLPPSELTREAVVRRQLAPALGIERWTDAAKVALVSGLTTPFAAAWLIRSWMVRSDPAISTYVSRTFLPVLIPFLGFQLLAHMALLTLGVFFRTQRRGPMWLVHAESQLWCGCLAFSLYCVGTFTHSFVVLLLALPVVGYLLFDARAVTLGMATLTMGLAIGIVLPLLGVVPYAPFLDHAPFDHGHLEPMWIVTAGIPSLFAALVGVVVHVRLVRGLRERQTELERLSSTDSLTGLWNRTVFYARLEEEIARTRRHDLPLTLLMIDVDHFKRVNDTYGHAVGDQVLRDLSERLRDALRAGDVAARYGGEELTILLPQTGRATAEFVAERLLLAARSVQFGPMRESVAVSIGLAELGPIENADALVARADKALYEAKNTGRDRFATAAAATGADATARDAPVQGTLSARGTHGRRRDEEEVAPR